MGCRTKGYDAMKNVIAPPAHQLTLLPLLLSAFGWTLHVGGGRETKEKMEISKARAAELYSPIDLFCWARAHFTASSQGGSGSRITARLRISCGEIIVMDQSMMVRYNPTHNNRFHRCPESTGGGRGERIAF